MALDVVGFPDVYGPDSKCLTSDLGPFLRRCVMKTRLRTESLSRHTWSSHVSESDVQELAFRIYFLSVMVG